MMPEIRHVPAAPTRAQRLPAGATVTSHRHDDRQIVYAARGVLTVETDAGAWVAPANRAIWVPAGTVHAHHAHGDAEMHLIGVARPRVFATPTVLNVDPLLRELILACTRDPGDGGPARRRMRAVLLDRVRAAPEQPLHLPAPSDPRLVTLAAILRADPADGRTLAELGRAVGASDRTLSRLFRAETGMTFPQWRAQLRLHRALLLLAEGVPVTSVAHRCGWASASAFIDVFRRVFGRPPGRMFHPAVSTGGTGPGDGAVSRA